MKNKLLIIALLMVMTSCTAIPPALSEGPPLIVPVATQMDTFVVERGLVEQKYLMTGMLRIHSVPLYFDLPHALLGDIFVEPGDEVTAGQVLARINVDVLEDQIASQVETISRLRRLHNLEREQSALELDILILFYNTAMQNAATTLDPRYLEQAESLRESIEWETLLGEQARLANATVLSTAERRLSELREGLAGIYITAPFDGVITNVLASEGMWVRRNQHILFIAEASQTVFVEHTDRNTHPTPRALREAAFIRAFIGNRFFDLEIMELTDEEQVFYSQRSMNAVGQVVLPLRFNILVPAEELPPLGESVTIMLYTVWYEDVLRIPFTSFYMEHAYDPFRLINQIVEIDSHWRPYVLRLEGDVLEMAPVTAHITSTFIAILDGLEEGDVIFVRP